MDEKAETEFDVEAVPAFPVLTLWLDENAEHTELNGVPIEPAPGEGYQQAAIAAVVRETERLALDAVRVRVLSPSGEAWDMVVTADGQVYDTTVAEPETDQPTRGARRRRWPLIGACAVGGLALGGVGMAAVVAATGSDTAPAWEIPGVDQQIPIALPEEFSARSAWSVPVAEGSDVTALDTGHILSTDPDNTLTARVPDTGQPVWRGTNAPEDLTGAVHTNWAGAESLVARAGNELRIWDLRTPEDGSTVAATSLHLEHEWRSEVRGERPFVAKEHWIVGIPAAGNQLTDVVIPAGSRALTVTGQNQIITASESGLYTVTEDGTVTGQQPYTPPTGVTGAPGLSWMLDADHALLGWATEAGATVMAILNVKDGSTLTTTEVPRAPDQRHLPLVDAEARTAAFDTLAVSWGENLLLRPLHSYETSTLNGATAYGMADRTDPASLDLSQMSSVPEPWATFTDEDPSPGLVSDDAAYIVTDTLDTTVLYRSEHANTSEEK